MTKIDLRLNPDAILEIKPIGEQVCVVVDNFLRNPDSVIEFAQENRALFEMPPKSYPGLVMDVASSESVELLRYVKSRMSRHFPFMRGDLKLTTMLSMTTLQPDKLSNLQRLCHSDPITVPGRANYAGLLYLFKNEDLGGTGFYRWKDRPLIEQATALEMKDPVAALRFLREHFPTYNQPPSYITKSNEIAELVERVPARFNRWVFYSGDMPHSAYIEYPAKLTDSFAAGRLTLNCFASAIPR